MSEEKLDKNFSYITNDPNLTDDEKISELNRLIDDELVGVSDVKKMKKPKSRNMTIAIILIVAGMTLIFMNYVWYSILGFFLIVPGIGFAVGGIVDLFPDKLAKMDYMDEAKERLKILRREKKFLESKISKETN